MENAFRTIQCKNCGGVMSPDQRTHSFQCAYCGTNRPWPAEGFGDLPVLYRHKPAARVDGLIKLGHVEIMGIPQMPLLDDPLGTAEALRRWDPRTAAVLAGAWNVSFSCPACGGEVQGLSTQSIFQCAYCGNKIGAEEALRPGAYRRELVMGAGAEYVPDQAVPYRLTLENAHIVLRGLCAAFPDILGAVAEQLKEELAAIYIPFSLADLSVKAQVKSDRGSGLIYQETIDWACPETSIFDIRVLDHLEPWNFDEVGAFDPAFCEGDIRIASVSNLVGRGKIIDALLYDRVKDDVMDAFGVKKVDISKWSSDLRKHKYSTLLLPTFFAEVTLDNQGSRIAVAINGQTGASAACLRQKDGKRTMVTGRGVEMPEMSEHTIRTPAVPVRYVRSPFLHQILPAEKAFKKRWLFG